MLPDIPASHRGAKLTARAGAVTVADPQALLVSNDPYETGDIAGLSRRADRHDGHPGPLCHPAKGAAGPDAQRPARDPPAQARHRLAYPCASWPHSGPRRRTPDTRAST
jgi:hypothetical protein